MPNEELIKVLRSVIQEELKPITQRLDNIETNVSTLENKIDNIENKIDTMKHQQDENTGLIQAIIHNVEVVNAEVSGLKISTPTHEAIAGLDSKIDEGFRKMDSKLNVLVIRQTDQEAELQRLKIAK